MINLASYIEYDNGNKQNIHVWMRFQMDNGDVEEVDLYTDDKGKKYHTRLDADIIAAPFRKRMSKKEKLRVEIIQAFNDLFSISGLYLS